MDQVCENKSLFLNLLSNLNQFGFEYQLLPADVAKTIMYGI